jgi:hypothetical protein
MQAGHRKGDTVLYIVRHKAVIGGRVRDISPTSEPPRKTRVLYWAAWRMRRRIYKRFGYQMEIQKSTDGYALWRPGEEISLIRQK